MSGNRYKSFRLRNGEEIVGEVVGVTGTSTKLFRPVLMKTVVMPDMSTGTVKEFVLFKEWLPSTENEFTLHKDYIMTQYTPSAKVMKSYLEYLERLDVAQDIAKELMNDPDALEDFLRTKINEELGEDSLEEEPTDNSIPSNDVQMNFVMNPRMFMEFLHHGILSLNDDEDGENGIEIDPDAFMETYEEMKQQEEESKEKPPRRAKKKRGEWDYGNQFDNWDPKPD